MSNLSDDIRRALDAYNAHDGKSLSAAMQALDWHLRGLDSGTDASHVTSGSSVSLRDRVLAILNEYDMDPQRIGFCVKELMVLFRSHVAMDANTKDEILGHLTAHAELGRGTAHDRAIFLRWAEWVRSVPTHYLCHHGYDRNELCPICNEPEYRRARAHDHKAQRDTERDPQRAVPVHGPWTDETGL